MRNNAETFGPCDMPLPNDRLLVRVGIDARNDHQKVPGFDNGRTEE